MPVFKSLKKPPLSKEVEDQLLKAIISGVFKAEDRLPSERELMAQFEVSRATIREALKNLQGRGLISIERGQNGGSYVCEPSAEPIIRSLENLIAFGKIDFGHLIEARVYIEPEAARAAAAFATEQDTENLRKLLDKAEKYSDTCVKKARLCNMRFHYEICKISKNPIIIFISESITRLYMTALIEGTNRQIKKTEVLKMIARNRDTLKSIIQRDANAAYKKSRKHLLENHSLFRRIMKTT